MTSLHWPVFADCVNCYDAKNMMYMTECSQCHDDVCISKKCCTRYQMANNMYLTVCHSCKEKIENKFELILDFSKLTLLKKKIKSNTTYQQQHQKHQQQQTNKIN